MKKDSNVFNVHLDIKDRVRLRLIAKDLGFSHESEALRELIRTYQIKK